MVTVSSQNMPIEVPKLDRFPAEPFKISNSLTEHPLFETERLKKLLRTLPRECIDIRAVQTSDQFDGNYSRAPRVDEDPVEVFERLEERPAWMLLHKTWKLDPEYGAMIQGIVDQMKERIPEMQPDVTDVGCWIFLSSGKSVVHFHADPDQSFLSQIRGSKTVYVYPAKILPQPDLEELVATKDHGAIKHRPEYESQMYPPVHLAPGESVFLPLFAPHRVTNDEGVSVSINIGFHTRTSKRAEKTILTNRALRGMGLKPRAWRESPWLDTWKAHGHLLVRVRDKLKSLLGIGSRD